ncbi:hypothetical protein LTR36_008202 [Oleoguttula mirabilis]|uniref:Peptidase A1 domain-containing protein n=1 Tax=Oleoguttula mirabilis TaxID=1507867 RepID=A0AAV9J8G1_9PEZI|nr:hypothetical protein LTR36_008202 [Oleoguttula mirabilis]
MSLNTFEEVYLGLTGSGYYGFDTVNLGIAGQNLPTLQNQLVAGFATDNYWLGSLGLSPATFNISDLNSPIPSLLGTLYNQSYVPGSSWAYTAGAFYQTPPVLGSLTFGGYDRSRMDSNHTLSDIAFGPESSRDLVVQLQAITYNTIGGTPLLTKPIEIFIDSMVSSLWLPLEVCQEFEKAFNLTWNTNSSLYLLDEDVHTALLAQNPTFTFTLGNETGGETVDIVFPYAAFDLNVTLPITNGPSRYFPLQRAQNSTQYTLGRVFLQEAYVVADYDRQIFSVSQALFPSTSVPQQLVAICAPGHDAACRTGGSGGLSTGAIVGIVICVVVLLCLTVAGMVWKRRSKRRRQQEIERTAAAAEHSYTAETKGTLSKSEAEYQDRERHEMDPGSGRQEMDSGNELRPELAGGYQDLGMHNRHEIMTSWKPHEMPTQEVAAHELEAPLK